MKSYICQICKKSFESDSRPKGCVSCGALGEYVIDDAEQSVTVEEARKSLRYSFLKKHWDKPLAILIAGLFMFESYEPLNTMLFIIMPLACILLSDMMGNITNQGIGAGTVQITNQTPAVLVKIGGWVVLLMPVWMGIIFSILTNKQ